MKHHFFFFWPRHVPFGILVPQPSQATAVKVPSPNHWTTRKSQESLHLGSLSTFCIVNFCQLSIAAIQTPPELSYIKHHELFLLLTYMQFEQDSDQFSASPSQLWLNCSIYLPRSWLTTLANLCRLMAKGLVFSILASPRAAVVSSSHREELGLRGNRKITGNGIHPFFSPGSSN